MNFNIGIERDPAETTTPCFYLELGKYEFYAWWGNGRPHFLRRTDEQG